MIRLLILTNNYSSPNSFDIITTASTSTSIIKNLNIIIILVVLIKDGILELSEIDEFP